MRNFRSDVHCSDLQRPLYVDSSRRLRADIVEKSNCENLVLARIASSELVVVTASHLGGSQAAKPVTPANH